MNRVSLDLSSLPGSVRATARLVNRGREVMWHRDHARAAIDALVENGCVILGLDLRRVERDDRMMEIAWSSFEPSGSDHDANVRLAAIDARDALDRFERTTDDESMRDVDWVLVTWAPPAASGTDSL